MKPEQVLAKAIVNDGKRIGTLERMGSSHKRSPTRGKWQAPTLQGDWVDHSASWSSSGFALDNDGWVHLKGLIRGSGTSAIFTLPISCRPEQRHLLPVKVSSGYGYIDVTPAGVVTMTALVGNTSTWVSLDGGSFPLESWPSDATPMQWGEHPLASRWTGGIEPEPFIGFSTPWTRRHAGGFGVCSGVTTTAFSTATSPMVLFNMPGGPRSMYSSIGVALAKTAGGTPFLHRISPNTDAIYSLNPGYDPGQWWSFNGVQFPTMECFYEEDGIERDQCTIVTGTAHPHYNPNIDIYRDRMGQIHITGLLTVTPSTSTHLLTLPAGWEPDKNIIMKAFGGTNGGIASTAIIALAVNTDGTVTVNQGSSGGWCSFGESYWQDNS